MTDSKLILKDIDSPQYATMIALIEEIRNHAASGKPPLPTRYYTSPDERAECFDWLNRNQYIKFKEGPDNPVDTQSIRADVRAKDTVECLTGNWEQLLEQLKEADVEYQRPYGLAKET